MNIPIMVCDCHGDQDCVECGGLGLKPISQNEKLNEALREAWNGMRDKSSCFTCPAMPICPLPEIALHSIMDATNANLDEMTAILDDLRSNQEVQRVVGREPKLANYLRIVVAILVVATKEEE